MKNKNFVLNCFKTTLSIQIISLNNSYFIYIGTSQLSFDTLTVSFPVDSLNSTSTAELLDDSPNQFSNTLASVISSKLKAPVYLSMNIYDETLLNNPMLPNILEDELIKTIRIIN